MSLTEPVTVTRLGPVPRSAAQTRTIDAALDLFAEHGVNGTSLQMIADAIGVTKAAIYHQFKTKDEIVFAAVEVELVKLETVLDAAEAEVDPAAGARARARPGDRPRGRAPPHGERGPARSRRRPVPRRSTNRSGS